MKPIVEKLEEHKILIKWAPILDVLEIKDNDIRNFIAVYAEHHQDNFSLTECPRIEEMYGKEPISLLPVSLKLLSMLNLTGKNIEIRDKKDVKSKKVSIKIKRSEVEMYAQYGRDIIARIETALINELACQINDELKTNNNFYVHRMVSYISLIVDDFMDPVITMISECKVE
jgi:hypothetical protein